MRGIVFFLAAAGGVGTALAPSAALADRVRPWQLEIDLGLRGGSNAFIVEGKVFGGWCMSVNDGGGAVAEADAEADADENTGGNGSGDAEARKGKKRGWLPFFGAGLAMSAGTAYVDDPRGLDGSASTGRFSFGAEFRVGWAGEAGTMNHYAYLAVAPMYAVAEKPYGDLPEFGGAFGVRSALGLGWPGKWRPIFSDKGSGGCSDSSDCALENFFLLLLPNHVELTYENVAGTSHRVGGALGYAF